MKKLATVAALLVLSGCAQVNDYRQVVKAPAPSGLAGYWQSQGPQSALVSPEAIASLIVTEQGDTLDCREWQRVIALPGKLTIDDGELVNVTEKLDVYPIERTHATLSYDGMTLQRVERPTAACAQALAQQSLSSPLP
ncbi:lipoprotein YedD [Entomohabitans teleogrylli]|uniref:lipoprotein YedD n=1 Tax=Entomohabitans teleogrylli TaxID=1384589 RepID=UPI00073D4ECC|nr:lipoprotein YedD [Entomohabitans teleogrylli]